MGSNIIIDNKSDNTTTLESAVYCQSTLSQRIKSLDCNYKTHFAKIITLD